MASMEHVRIDCETHRLEAVVQWGSSKDGALIGHPHPLYGGSMDNNVVLALEAAYRDREWTTVRFNFRGVGASTGTYGHGDGEAKDMVCVQQWLKDLGVQSVHLAGYSFGAWVALKACRLGMTPHSLALVSPPINFLDFTDLSIPSCPTWVMVGDTDAFAEAHRVDAWAHAHRAQGNSVHVDLCPNADHFYWGREQEIRRCLGLFLDSLTGSARNP
ncbi:alpha/beta hydrolase [Desulfosoma caldarium]|uniref:AB hydrolase-1 domain-containing protein n=1 Tax=Desulfosoma caldarium TaxID=610254 RepID=A0A3N1UPX3_9BACT|nr:hypothetical protein EDC27_1795 [Desulfosoma caldarium]